MIKLKFALLIVLFFLQTVAVAYSSDEEANQQMIQGSWYCSCFPDKYEESCYRFDFNSDGTLMMLHHNQSENKKITYWSSWWYVKPMPYSFESPTEIKIGTNRDDNKFLIMSLASNDLTFKSVTPWGKIFYSCSRTRPSGDTDESRAKAEAWVKSWNNFYYGKWWTKDRKESMEFFKEGVCVSKFLEKNNQWRINKQQYHAEHEGKSCCVGDYCAYNRRSENVIVMSDNHGNDAVTFYREKSKK